MSNVEMRPLRHLELIFVSGHRVILLMSGGFAFLALAWLIELSFSRKRRGWETDQPQSVHRLGIIELDGHLTVSDQLTWTGAAVLDRSKFGSSSADKKGSFMIALLRMRGRLKLAFLLLVCGIVDSDATVIQTRSELLDKLGPSAVTENFESYLFPTNTAQKVGITLDASSVIAGQGPGLVVDGVRFMGIGDSNDVDGILQWDRQFEFGLESAALVTSGILQVDFTSPVTHFGLDMFWFDVGFPLAHPATVQVFGADDVSLLYSVNIFEPFAPESLFFGYQDSDGIGRVSLFRQEGRFLGVSPIIDNLTFGSVPEPSSLALVAVGLAAMVLRTKRRANVG